MDVRREAVIYWGFQWDGKALEIDKDSNGFKP